MFNGDIYNGTNYTVTEIIFKITVKEKNGKSRWTRDLAASGLHIAPKTIKGINIRAYQATDIEDNKRFEWEITNAKGYKN